MPVQCSRNLSNNTQHTRDSEQALKVNGGAAGRSSGHAPSAALSAQNESPWLMSRLRVLTTAFFAALLVLIVVSGALHSQSIPLPSTGTVRYVSNLRAGPGTTYAIVGTADAGQRVTVFDCNEGCTWYQLLTGEWIYASLVQLDVSPSLTPTPTLPVPVTPTRVVLPTATSMRTPVARLPTATPTRLPGAAGTETLTVVGWNVESGEADPQTIAARIADFQGVDVWGLAEVNSARDARLYVQAAGEGENAPYASILGTTGGGDRLLILYDTDRFQLVQSDELDRLNIGGNVRAPLYAQLRNRENGTDFLFMVNHLYRSDDAGRHAQAQGLNDWAEVQTLPMIAVGDYNFDWSLPTGEYDHDTGYDLLTADSVWTWERPARLVTTQCSDWPCRYDSVLDFVFTANQAQDWPVQSDIIVVPGDFPDDQTTSDHRPVRAVFTLP